MAAAAAAAAACRLVGHVDLAAAVATRMGDEATRQKKLFGNVTCNKMMGDGFG